MKKYLVTGGAGFIGSHIVEELLNHGHEVVVLDDLSTGHKENIPKGVTFVKGSICDESKVREAFKGIDGVFHMAAIASVQKSIEEWVSTHQTNLTGTIEIFEHARANKLPVVYASSAAIYGDNSHVPLAETEQPVPLSAYGADKYGCELHGRVANHIHGVPNIGCRFFNVYGPRQDPSSPYSGVISIFADKIKASEDVSIFGDGKQTRDFIYVKDVVKALFASMSKLEQGEIKYDVFNVCTKRETSVQKLAETIMAISGNTVNIVNEEPREGDIRISLGNPGKMNKALGVSADTELKDGLKILLA